MLSTATVRKPSATREFRANDVDIQRQVAVGTKHLRKLVDRDPAEQDIRIGDRERATLAIAGGTGTGTGGLRPDLVALVLVLQDRSATGSDGMDLHHRSAQSYAGDLGVIAAFVLTAPRRDVRRCAAHVEAD
jgi:hypothetical protein